MAHKPDYKCVKISMSKFMNKQYYEYLYHLVNNYEPNDEINTLIKYSRLCYSCIPTINNANNDKTFNANIMVSGICGRTKLTLKEYYFFAKTKFRNDIIINSNIFDTDQIYVKCGQTMCQYVGIKYFNHILNLKNVLDYIINLN